MNRVMRTLGSRYDYTRFKRVHGHDPFRVLVGCIISLRTKDEVTYPATERLFERELGQIARETVALVPRCDASADVPVDAFAHTPPEEIDDGGDEDLDD